MVGMKEETRTRIICMYPVNVCTYRSYRMLLNFIIRYTTHATNVDQQSINMTPHFGSEEQTFSYTQFASVNSKLIEFFHLRSPESNENCKEDHIPSSNNLIQAFFSASDFSNLSIFFDLSCASFSFALLIAHPILANGCMYWSVTEFFYFITYMCNVR